MTETLLVIIGLVLGALLLTFAMRTLVILRQARIRLVADDAYRELAAKSLEAQSNTAASLAAIQTELSEIKTTLAAIDTVLKAIE